MLIIQGQGEKFQPSLKLTWKLGQAAFGQGPRQELVSPPQKCAAAQSMDSWAAIKKALHWFGGGLSRVSCRLQARPRTFHLACMLPPMPMEPWAVTKKKDYHTHSVAVTPTPFRFPTQCCLSQVSRTLCFSPCPRINDSFNCQKLEFSAILLCGLHPK